MWSWNEQYLSRKFSSYSGVENNLKAQEFQESKIGRQGQEKDGDAGEISDREMASVVRSRKIRSSINWMFQQRHIHKQNVRCYQEYFQISYGNEPLIWWQKDQLQSAASLRRLQHGQRRCQTDHHS